MGLIIIPILLGAAIISLICLYHSIKWYREGKLEIQVILFGIIISILIYTGIALSYYKAISVWALQPFFRIPFWMFYVPGIVGLILIQSQNEIVNKIAKSIIISIVISGIFILLFDNYAFGILDYLGVKKVY